MADGWLFRKYKLIVVREMVPNIERMQLRHTLKVNQLK